MYEDYYRFHRQPFNPTPDPEFLYKSESHELAFEQLRRGVHRREGVLLLTGDVGTGKTTTTRALLEELEPDVFTALVINPFVTADELLRVLLRDFEVVSDTRVLENAGRQSLVETLNQFLLSLAAVGASALAVLDEAQNLTPAVLEQLRVLTTLETDHEKLLQILLVGQPELETLLATPDLRPLNQRIARRCALRPLTREEVEQYIEYRVRIAREDWEMVFDRQALDRIAECSAGIPRQINLLCDRALEAGFLALSQTIDETLVTEAAEALHLVSGTALRSGAPRSVSRKTVSGEPIPSRPTAAESPPRKPRRSLTRWWVAAAAALGTVFGLGALLVVLGPRTPRSGPPLPGSPGLAALVLPTPVEFVSGTDQGYLLQVSGFDTLLSADVAVAMLRAQGGSAMAASDGVGAVAWIGPYPSLTEARSMEQFVQRRFESVDVRIVAGYPADDSAR